jgi:hypothetical protein
MRNLHLDAVRGYCLLVMTINHLHVYGLNRVSQDTFGFFGAAEGFIFISGLVAGSYYSRLAERSGEGAGYLSHAHRPLDANAGGRGAAPAS